MNFKIFILFLAGLCFFSNPAFANHCSSIFDNSSDELRLMRTNHLDAIENKNLKFSERKQAVFDHLEFLAVTENEFSPNVLAELLIQFSKKEQNQIMEEMGAWSDKGVSPSQQLTYMRLNEAPIFSNQVSTIDNIQGIIRDYGVDFLVRKRYFLSFFWKELYQEKPNYYGIIHDMQSFSIKESIHIVNEIKPLKEKGDELDKRMIEKLSGLFLFHTDLQTREKILDSQWALVFDLNAVNGESRTPLHKAIIDGEVKIALLLIQRGADISIKDKAENAAIHLAAYHGLTEVVKLLIQKGANVHRTNKLGYNPLMAAASGSAEHHKKIKITKLLIEQGVLVDARAKNGDTAADMAFKREGSEGAAALLEKAEQQAKLGRQRRASR